MKQHAAEKKKIERSNGFLSFMTQKEQLRELAIFGTVYVALFIIVSACYPHMHVTADTGSYIQSAQSGIISGYRPIGYSCFLGYFHNLSPGMGLLFTGQFVMHALATLFFIFTVKYLFLPARKWVFYVFAAFVIAEPNVLALANLVMSDSIFTTLTLLFVTGLLWLNRAKSTLGNGLLLAIHLLLLYLTFEVRYVALFYPLLSVLFLLATAEKKWKGALLALLPVLVTFMAYRQTKTDIKRHYGADTFSAFGGWATANNAVSIIPYIDLKPEELDDPNSRFIHSVVVQFPDSVFSNKAIRNTLFMWDKTYPGKLALLQFRQQYPMTYIRGWVHMGVMMGTYGNTLIRKYPTLYLQHYLLPNAGQCFVHYPVISTETFKPDSLQKKWFNLTRAEYPVQYPLFTAINTPLRVLFYLRWALFAAGLLFIAMRFRRFAPRQKTALAVVLLFVVCYIGFSVVSHPINNYRYLVPLYAFMLFVPYAALNRLLPLHTEPNTINENEAAHAAKPNTPAPKQSHETHEKPHPEKNVRPRRPRPRVRSQE